ncbi:unnamed protein product [Spirodela intermedia]|uniref:Uncharacterized protein n=2 Tax=Spirodela intermedia TaxID=51605 RepID=A0ABN7EDF3_SPIIN|nr:unnamed protein product [Spirodela intermedia]CAA6675403.1 unnamed protein product [Spirodela intermedia]CAA7392897.1 unnamed protein product [Spirodela intermedia]
MEAIWSTIPRRVEPSWFRQCWKWHDGGRSSGNSSGGL